MSRKRINVVPKDYRPLVKAAVDQGWTFTQTRHGHPKLTAPDGYATPVPSSSSDPRLLRAMVVRLRARGVEL